MKQEKIYIYGKHALTEALAASPQAITKIFLAKNFSDANILKRISERRISVSELKGDGTGYIKKTASHQGIIAVIHPEALMVSFEDFMKSISPEEDTLLVLLDGLHDPQNVGAIIRSATALGAAAVLIPASRQAQISGAVIKSSAGMAFRIPLVSVPFSSHALKKLKEKGFRSYGLAMKGSHPVGSEKFSGPTIVVIGNEGNGIQPDTVKLCDTMVRIPMRKGTESLNAAVSAGIAFHAWAEKHPAIFKK